ncbi:sperm microtubule associated protein 2 [Nelusetta ayraudi]|uniref:sperm microtubule associated protein 2 n=1 Tax=Nelusetta ayraudi TaxID=303726 RepID=UPI003F6EB0E4
MNPLLLFKKKLVCNIKKKSHCLVFQRNAARVHKENIVSPSRSDRFVMSARTERLAQPKPNRLRHPDRRSVYWLDELPAAWTGPASRPELSPRWSELCRSKRFYAPMTRSPIWEVSSGALKAVASSRLCRLALPRPAAAGWQPIRPLSPTVQRAAWTTAAATVRICQLAQPKRKPALEGLGPTPKAPTTAYKASAHTELLAAPKPEHPKFRGERPALWPVSGAAGKYEASRRLRELSSPRERKALFEGYDPYTVSRAALSACPSPRVRQLSAPLPRKCSSK